MRQNLHRDADEDFLVMLSALSSTSNTITMTAKPLDIVMVFDVSGSMDDKFGDEEMYIPTYSVNIIETYYALVDDAYQRVTRAGGLLDRHWELNGQTVEPKTSASDTNGIQFYTLNVPSRLDVLKSAASSFIDKTEELNSEIADASRYHHVAITTFASSATTVQNLTENSAALKNSVSNLSASGGTQADDGMAQAQTVLNGSSARADAQKIVIFFTDGEPGNYGFDSSVANDAIGTSKELKDAGALVYSIGIFDGADEDSVADQTNQYMQGVSSNYLDATAYTSLGTRNPDGKKYYRSAQDAGQLNNIFNEIFEAVSSVPASPTDVQDGYEPGKSGYLTFTDQVGAYMHVTRFHELSFANLLHQPSATVDTDANGVKTYHYTGTVNNAQYPEADLADIIIQVTPGKTLAEGDIVTVQIPASVIPLRHIRVLNDENGGRTCIIDEILPIRVIYGVSLKPEVKETIADGLDQNDADDAALQAYINDHATADGKISFYSNYYDGSIKGQLDSLKTLGNTTATFTPAQTNSFYFFTEDTPLYRDEACTQRLTHADLDNLGSGQSVYYERRYLKSMRSDGTGAVTEEVAHQEIPAANLAYVRSHIGQDADGNAFIERGATRLTRVNSIKFEKESNPTGTAPEVLGSQWNDLENGQYVNVHLGNNGKLDLELPATLAIYKDAQVTAGKGLDAGVTKNKDFTFEVTVDPAMLNESGTYSAGIRDVTNTLVGDHFTVTFNKTTGKSTTPLKLQDEQTLHIHGLPGGATYTVSEVEDSMPAGFTNTGKTGDTGILSANATSTASFVNVYDVDPVTLAADDFVKYKKDFSRWDLANSFTFDLMADNASYPMPEGSTGRNKDVQVTEDANTGNFGSVTYTRPGTYTYTVDETRPQGAAVPGVSYSRASYSVTVVVTDNGDGTLSATASMVKAADDHGSALAENVADKTAVFTNTFNAESVYAGPVAQKYYSDASGHNPISDGKFSFKGYPIGDNADSAPMPGGATGGEIIVGNVGNSVNYQQIEFTQDHVGNTYTYMLEEVMPADATADNGYTSHGMIYDPVKYTVEFTVTSQEVDGVPTVHVAKTYHKVVNGVPEATPTPEAEVAFRNSYDPVDLVIPNDTDNVPLGSKTLAGRDSLNGESFEFTLAAGNVPTSTALANDVIVFGNDPAAETATASVTGLKDGVAQQFDFGSMIITQPGTYVFTAHENAPATDGNGMAYDRHNVIIAIKVKDTDGVLELDGPVTYEGGSDTAATFVNHYTSNMTYGDTTSLTVAKTLNGRAMHAGEFRFNITGADEASRDKLSASDRSFEVTTDTPAGAAHAMPGKLAGLTFTHEDAGKTFTYSVSEAIPSAASKLSGVTYDETSYQVAITIIDDGDGTMHAETVVTKADGAPINPTTIAGRNVYTLPFVNEYQAGETTFNADATTLGLNKVLTGRDWLASDSFEFTLEAVTADAPMPAITKATVTSRDVKNGKAPFGFGEIVFDKAGDYTYQVTETNGGQTINGITYTPSVATFTIHVNDLDADGNPTGHLTATLRQVINSTFENTYVSELDYGAKGGLSIFKTLNGRDMAAGQFGFTVKPQDQASADKFGIALAGQEFKNPDEANAGVKSLVKTFGAGVKFSHADAGKTYAFVVTETSGGATGYTNDATEYGVLITTRDNLETGVLEVTTTVYTETGSQTYVYSTATGNSDAAELPFVNTYNATGTLGGAGNVKIDAGKELTGRPQDAGEFSFVVTDIQDNVVTTGKNAADGTISFDPVNYTSESLVKAVNDNLATRTIGADGTITYEFQYKVSEITSQLPTDPDNGVSGSATSFSITVKLVDDGSGTLGITVGYPRDMDELPFKNTYTSTSAPFSLAGTKVLVGAPIESVADKFTFTITGEDGAPLPAKTQVSNGIRGNVIFGEVTFTQDHLAGVTPDEHGARTKTFTYHVTESGAAPGVTNDVRATKSFTLTVTDDGQGHVNVVSDHQDAAQFEFTNTYSTSPKDSSLTGDGAFTLTKKLDGRDLNAGEFEFDLVNVLDNQVVAKGRNDAAGKVAMDSVTFNEPGTYQYCLHEVDPNKSDGITYDTNFYNVTAHVTDNGDGTLNIEWTVVDAASGDELVFNNTYEVAPSSITFNAVKQLTGRALREGEFEFELVQEGKVIARAKNGAPDASGNATITFDAIAYDATGEFDYEIREVKGNAEGVTYDDTVFTYHVSVTDPGTGKLKVDWTVGANGAPVFKNAYTKGGTSSDGSGKGKMPQTGDMFPAALLAAGMIAGMGVAAAGVVLRRKNKA